MTTRRQQLTREQINIRSEVEYIVRRAAERDARVVTLGTLVFFSTETGDAWMLDPSDNVALCLARDGDLQPVSITETADTFAVDWNTSYQIKGEQFIITDRTSRVRTIIGYPISDIAQAIRQVRESSSQAGSTVIDRRTQTESSDPGTARARRPVRYCTAT